MLDLLTAREAAQELRRAPETLARWRKLKIGPDAIPVEGRWMYERASVSEFIERQKEAGSLRNSAERVRDDLAARLRAIRMAAGFSQAQLSDQVCIRTRRVRNIEQGLSVPREKEISDWVYACGAGDQEKDCLMMQQERALKVRHLQPDGSYV